MSDSLIPLGSAINLAKDAGFTNINKRWFERKIEGGVIAVHQGVVPYVSRSEVVGMISHMLDHAKNKSRA